MKEIIEKVAQEKDPQKRQRLLEEFQNLCRGKEKECAFVFRKALSYFEKGSDDEKIASLKVISRIFSGMPSPLFGIDDSKTEIKYDEIDLAVYYCLMFLKSKNGNLRLSSVHALNHLRGFLEGINYVELFSDLLCLRNYEKDRKIKKSIEFCLDKIWCPLLEELIELEVPLEIKKIKIDVKGVKDEKEKKLVEEVSTLINKMIDETERYIKRIMKLRGKYLLNENFILYMDNLALFQISYEIQKLIDMIEKKEINDDLADRYVKFRLTLCLKKNLKWLEKIENKNEFIYVDIDLKRNKVYLSTVKNVYSRFKNIYDKISHLADWSIYDDLPEFSEREEERKNYIG